MPYSKKPSAGGGTDLWPLAGTNIKIINGFNVTLEDIAAGATDNGLPLYPSDFFVEFPATLGGVPITHFKLLPGVFPATSAEGTWVPVDTPELVSYNFATFDTPCGYTGVQIINCYVSTDGTSPLDFASTFIIVDDSAGGCGGP